MKPKFGQNSASPSAGEKRALRTENEDHNKRIRVEQRNGCAQNEDNWPPRISSEPCEDSLAKGFSSPGSDTSMCSLRELVNNTLTTSHVSQEGAATGHNSSSDPEISSRLSESSVGIAHGSETDKIPSLVSLSLQGKRKPEADGRESATVSPPKDFEAANIVREACFGVIVTSFTSSCSISSDGNLVAVNMKPVGDLLYLTCQDTDEYAGILPSPVLCQLCQRFSVRLKAYLQAPPRKVETKVKWTRKPNMEKAEKYSVRITVYGNKCDKDAIGTLISDGGLGFQHPSLEECGSGVEYCNPHYLLAPGAVIPRLKELAFTTDDSSSSSTDVLDQSSKAKFLQAFDSADVQDDAIYVSVKPSHRLRSSLMPHQKTALALMIEREKDSIDGAQFPTLWRLNSKDEYCHVLTGAMRRNPKPLHGGILADEMGLGKTLSTLALICSTLDAIDSQASLKLSRCSLVVCRKSTLSGWQNQIQRHIHPGTIQSQTYHGLERHRIGGSLQQFDILFTTYETLRSDWEKRGPLYTNRWLRVVLDEAHYIRNRSSKISEAVRSLNARFRWCLSGTPIHNSLDDYGALLAFLEVKPVDTKFRFNALIASPLRNNRTGSLRKFEKLIAATCLRRRKASYKHTLNLPELIEKVHTVELSHEDRVLYDFFWNRTAEIARGSRKKVAEDDVNVLALMTVLRRICNHGKALLSPWALAMWTKQCNPLTGLQALGDSSVASGAYCSNLSDTELSVSPPHSTASPSASEILTDEQEDSTETTAPEDGELCVSIPTYSESTAIPPSAKLKALLKNLVMEHERVNGGARAKSVIFTAWTTMLDLVEPVLRKHGFTFARIDGTSSVSSTSQALLDFSKNEDCTIMLATFGSCGEGIDFTAGNYVHLLEPHWNPMVEEQAISRVHRKGQTRPVTATRYVGSDSIESYVRGGQQKKLELFESFNKLEAVVEGGSPE